MDGNAQALNWISDTKNIEVPFFQRPYVWTEEDFKSLVESFLDAPNNSMPFFGSIILKQFGEVNDDKYLVIDGQQRITTFNILIRVLLDKIENNDFTIGSHVISKLKEMVYNIESDNSGNDVYHLKLIPSNSDRVFFEKLMDTDIPRPINMDSLTDSFLDKAYKFFFEYFKNNDIDIASRFCLKLVSKEKSLIFIILDDKDDEQKIFDSVNSLGKALSNSDIIKNYLFQKMKEKANGDVTKENQVIEYYYKYWDSVFYKDGKNKFWYKEFSVGRINTDHIECFLRDFAVVKEFYASKKTTGSLGLCNAYKKHINKLNDEELLSLLKDINEYAEIYFNYKTAYADLDNYIWSDYKNRTLLILDWLDTTTFNPYILKLLKDNPEDIESKFFNFEKFFLTRFIYEGTPKNYNQCCEGLIKAENDEAFFAGYMKESPVENESYKKKFRKLSNKQGVLFMFLIEMLKRNGNESTYSDALNIRFYTLEHVFPQKWFNNPYWLALESYDDQFKLVDKNDSQAFLNNRNAAVKSIGNFALLTSKLNSSISNNSFAMKINGNGKENGKGMKGFAAALATTQDIIKYFEENENNVWDERKIYQNESNYFAILNNFYHFE